jgi:hypothetical protein
VAGVADDQRVLWCHFSSDCAPIGQDRIPCRVAVEQKHDLGVEPFQGVGDIASVIRRAVQIGDEFVVIHADHKAVGLRRQRRAWRDGQGKSGGLDQAAHRKFTLR